jgi:hypothetical protein
VVTEEIEIASGVWGKWRASLMWVLSWQGELFLREGKTRKKSGPQKGRPTCL